MSIDPNRTLNSLFQYNKHIAEDTQEKWLLKVAKAEDGRTYLDCVKKSTMSLWERFLTLFGASRFNLNNVLPIATEAANMPTNFPNRALTVCNFALNLQCKVTAHYEGRTEQKAVVDKINAINSLIKPDPAVHASVANIPKAAPKQAPKPVPLQISAQALSNLVQAQLTSIFGKEYKPGSIRGAEQFLQDLLQYEAREMGKDPAKKIISADTLNVIHFLSASIQDMKDPVFTWGMARDTGDCFFDAAAQGISHALGRKVTYRELKEEIQKFARDPKNQEWVKPLVEKDARKGGYIDFDDYLINIGVPIEEGRKIIWGRPHIEGLILSEIYGVRIHLLTGQKDPSKPVALAKELRELSLQNRSRFIELFNTIENTSDRLTVLKAYSILKTLKVEESSRLDRLEKALQAWLTAAKPTEQLSPDAIYQLGNITTPDTKTDFSKELSQLQELDEEKMLLVLTDVAEAEEQGFGAIATFISERELEPQAQQQLGAVLLHYNSAEVRKALLDTCAQIENQDELSEFIHTVYAKAHITISGEDLSLEKPKSFNKRMDDVDSTGDDNRRCVENDLKEAASQAEKKAELKALLADPKNEFLAPSWTTTEKLPADPTRKDVYMAVYPGHFFPMFRS